MLAPLFFSLLLPFSFSFSLFLAFFFSPFFSLFLLVLSSLFPCSLLRPLFSFSSSLPSLPFLACTFVTFCTCCLFPLFSPCFKNIRAVLCPHPLAPHVRLTSDAHEAGVSACHLGPIYRWHQGDSVVDAAIRSEEAMLPLLAIPQLPVARGSLPFCAFSPPLTHFVGRPHWSIFSALRCSLLAVDHV